MDKLISTRSVIDADDMSAHYGAMFIEETFEGEDGELYEVVKRNGRLQYAQPAYLPLSPMPGPKKTWRCIHCGRPNRLDRLTCEGCGAPEGEE